MQKFDAILWDCDGCLIDSEYIACDLGARLMNEAGYTISTTDYIARFCGQNSTHMFQSIREECGIDYSGHPVFANKKELQREAFRQDLKVIDGIVEVLDAIKLPMAIASGSQADRLEFTLQLTNLWERFMPHVYQSAMVAREKPHPDIFLFAAKKLNVAPQDCLVIEDSSNGVSAGVAAGMTVFGFTGGSHVPDKDAHARALYDLGAHHVFHDMRDLPGLILT